MRTPKNPYAKESADYFRKEMQKIKDRVIKRIKEFFIRNEIDWIDNTDFGSMSTPVIQENDNDVELTYTLDTIRMEDGTVTVSASNSFNSQEWKENNLQTDTLIDIFSYLERNEKNLFKEQ